MKGEYYKTKESVDDYILLANDVNGKQLINKLEKVLLANSILLEIGSGPGSDWKILNKSYQVTGSDNSKEFLNHLGAAYPDGEFLELDAVTLTTNKKFDGIYSNKVLHHLKDNKLVDSLRRQYEILNPQGIVCHSFWKGEGSENFKGLFVNYHNEERISEFFSQDFEIISVQEYKEFEDSDSLLVIGKKSL